MDAEILLRRGIEEVVKAGNFQNVTGCVVALRGVCSDWNFQLKFSEMPAVV